MALRDQPALPLKGVTCCCLVSVCFFSTLISHKIFNLKTSEAKRTDRNRQSQLRAGFAAAAALSWGKGAWEKAALGKTRNSMLPRFSLEHLLNAESIPALCAIVKREGGSPISYSLTSFAVVLFAPPGLGWIPSWVGTACQTHSESRNRGSAQLPDRPCPHLTSALAAEHWSLKPFDPPSLCLCTPTSPKLPTPHSSSRPFCCCFCTGQPPPPTTSSSLLWPPTSPPRNDFKTLLMSDFCLWLSSHRLLCLHVFTYDSTIFQSHHLAKWTDGGTEELVTWLCANLRFSLSLLLCSWLPLTVLLPFLTQMINLDSGDCKR